MATILVCDDEMTMCDVLKKIFMRSGYKVLTAGDGEAALTLFKENSIDLVVTDIIMPEKEGLETIIEMKKIDPEIKIIAMSGGGRQRPGDYLEMAETLGVKYTFAKPFERDDMLSAVNELLKNGPGLQ